MWRATLLDDFGLKRLSAQQSSDFYEVIIERHRRASTIVTSNRAIEEWIPLFDDPILAERARPARPQRPLDRHGRPQLSESPTARTGRPGSHPGCPGPLKRRAAS
jgi:IstB-like ATP binding protein